MSDIQPQSQLQSQLQQMQPPVSAISPQGVTFDSAAPAASTTPEVPAAPAAPAASTASITSEAPVIDNVLGQMNVTSLDPMQAIIDQQREQINALMAQTQALTSQITSLVQGGAQLNQAQQAQDQPIAVPQNSMPTQIEQMAQLGAQPDPLGTFNPPSLSNQADYTLESLAKDIGKPADKE